MNITLTQSFFASATNLLKHFPKAYPDIVDFMEEISKNPKAGDPVPGYSKLIYKIRGQLKSYRIGKQGGLWAYYFFNGQTLAVFFIYTKKEMPDAPQDIIKKLATGLFQEFPPIH